MCGGGGASADRPHCDQYLMRRRLQTDSSRDGGAGGAGGAGDDGAANGNPFVTGWAGAEAEGIVLLWGRDPLAFETLWDYKLGA